MRRLTQVRITALLQGIPIYQSIYHLLSTAYLLPAYYLSTHYKRRHYLLSTVYHLTIRPCVEISRTACRQHRGIIY